MDVQSTHRSRRSFPNLQQLSLAPLSSRFPIDGDDFEADPDNQSDNFQSSYIQGKSAPMTPSILGESRSSSRHRKTQRRSAHPEPYFSPDLEISDIQITKAKSAVGLVEANGKRRHHVRTNTGGTLSPMHARHHPRQAQGGDDEWLHRAGMIMSAEARENKGQSWMVNRDSSTSLVGQAMSAEHLEEMHSPVSPQFSRAHSRMASRVGSRAVSRAPSTKTSRRGSMVGGSRIGFMTPMGAKTPGSAGAAEGYFDDYQELAEPDFVDAEEDDHVDEEEVSRLASQRAFGFGGIVDRLVGFSLFNVDEDTEETEDDGARALTKEDAVKRKQEELKKRRQQLERAAKNSADATRRAEQTRAAGQEDEGGWKDAAWLLSVASKVLY